MMVLARTFTSRNLRIIEKLVKSAPRLELFLLTGSNAWGANYAVNSKSDIDILIVVKNISQLRSVIKNYIREGLVDNKELERLQMFQKLYVRKKAEQYSLNSYYGDAKISIDFIMKGTIEKIISLKCMKIRRIGSVNIRVIEEFRTNPPLKKGYFLKTSKKLIYHPRYKVIHDSKGNILGYVSETLIDGFKINCKQKQYYVGVISFFLIINPLILVDKAGRFNKLINKMRNEIIKFSGKLPRIPREERMDSKTIENIKNSFLQNIKV